MLRRTACTVGCSCSLGDLKNDVEHGWPLFRTLANELVTQGPGCRSDELFRFKTVDLDCGVFGNVTHLDVMPDGLTAALLRIPEAAATRLAQVHHIALLHQVTPRSEEHTSELQSLMRIS